jgi:mRNA interferase RelE/StbE
MSWKVELTLTAIDCLKAIRDSAPTSFARIKKTIDKLSFNPTETGKRLTDPLSHYWSARAGDYRIIYIIKNDVVTVSILYAGHRKDVYKKIERFLKG